MEKKEDKEDISRVWSCGREGFLKKVGFVDPCIDTKDDESYFLFHALPRSRDFCDFMSFILCITYITERVLFCGFASLG
jgi:hypothetical protein